jgi:alpha-ketoglutarate-dependent taurine dioxygenase
MSDKEYAEPNRNKMPVFRRKEREVSLSSLVKSGYLPETDNFPLVVEPATAGVNLAQWATGAGEYLERELLRHGAILFRGFGVEKAEGFEAVARAMSPQLLDYRERSSPRSEISNGVYTSTDHPASQYIHFHNEQSYARRWPMKLYFFCLQPAEQGGATPIADGRRVLSLIPPDVKEKFKQKKVLYLRNYGSGFGLSWQTAFQTTQKSEVESYCRQSGINFEWTGEDKLRTRQIFRNVEVHPKTGEETWFEHAAFFHVSSLEPLIREALLAEFKEEDLPSNTYYGDGTPIEPAALESIREAYRRASVAFPWQQRDLLLIDNMLVSHSREPYRGARKVLVAMAELYTPPATGLVSDTINQ